MAKDEFLHDDHEDFAIYDPGAIVQILRQMARREILLNGVFNAGQDSLLTVVLDVRPDERVFYIDASANEERNRRILASELTFHAHVGAAKVKWRSSGAAEAQFDGGKAFRLGIPERVQRIQRRNTYRVNTPVNNPVTCRIPLEDGRHVTLKLVDICVEGIGVVLPDPPEPAFEKGAEFYDCVISHPELGEITVDLSVQNVWEVELKNGSKSRRAGLEFVDIAAWEESVIQRFVYKMERLVIGTRGE